MTIEAVLLLHLPTDEIALLSVKNSAA